VPGEVEDRIADELSRPVVGRATAAVGLDDRDVGLLGEVELVGLGAAPERDRRRVLEEEHRLGNGPLRERRRERALELPRLAVVDEAEVHQVRPLHGLDCSGRSP
jgi:hypothetical protein